MNRTEFIAVTAIVLFLAIALGWFAHWLVHRFIRVHRSEMDEVDRMAKALHEAEEQRDQAVDRLRKREAELVGNLSEAKAETRAAMGALRELRRHEEELRAYVERINQGQ